MTFQEQIEIQQKLRTGGSWLGAARSYVQAHAGNGETVIWGSEEAVTLSMRQIEELALQVAVQAIGSERAATRRSPE